MYWASLATSPVCLPGWSRMCTCDRPGRERLAARDGTAGGLNHPEVIG